jgi:PAS domain S-box-containing protein
MQNKYWSAGRLLFGTIALLSIIIIIAGYLHYRSYERNHWIEIKSKLHAITELKKQDLTQWREERLVDGEYFHENPFLSILINQIIANPSQAMFRNQMQEWLNLIQSHSPQYNRITLFDLSGEEICSAPNTPVIPSVVIQQQIHFVSESRKTRFVDFYKSDQDQKVYLAVLVPVRSFKDNGILAVLMLRIDPAKYLYPYISRWPVFDRTSETLLVRREESDVLYLSELKYRKRAALSYRISLSNKDLPAVKAILGKSGFVDGIDYRGVPVVADVSAIPESPWYLVSRMDKAEAFAPLRSRLWEVIFGCAILLGTAWMGLGFFWKKQKAQYYREKAESAESLRELNEYLEITLKSIGDAVIVTDASGIVKGLNPIAETLTGWSMAEAVGNSLTDIFPIINAETRQPIENPIIKVLKTGTIVGLANHTVLISKKGIERQIADSASPIRDAKGHIRGVVLIFRDVSAEYEAAAALERNRLELQAVYDHAPVMMCAIDGNRHVLYANNAFSEFAGRPSEEFKGCAVCRVLGCLHALEDARGAEFIAFCRSCSLSQAIEDTFRSGIAHHDIEYRTVVELNGRSNEIVMLGATALFPAAENNHLLLCLMDITPTVRVQESLRESEEKFKVLFDSMEEGVALHEIINDADGIPIDYLILDYNPAYIKHTGLSPKRGVSASMAYGTGKPPYIEEFGRVTNDERPFHFETFFPPLDRYFSISVVATGAGRFATVFEDISEQKLNESKLRASEAFSSGILDSLTAHIAVINKDGFIVAVNEAWRRYALENNAQSGDGYAGMNYLAVCEEAIRSGGDKTSEMALRKIEEAMKGNKDFVSVEYACHSPKEECWFAMHATPLVTDDASYVVIAHENISKQKKAQEYLRLQEEFSRVLLENITDAVIACDANMNLVLFNRRAREWHGADAAKLPTEQWSSYYNLFDADGIRPLSRNEIPLVRAFEGGGFEPVAMTIKANGQPLRYLMANGSAFYDDDGNKIGAVVVLRDITLLHKNMEELQASVREKEALLREVHHRVKNNLQVVSSLLSLESARIGDPSTQKTLRDMKNRIRSMALLHETIYSSESLARVEMALYLERLCRHLIQSLLQHPEFIKLELEIAPVFLDVSQAVPCGLLINELLSNCLKHAFPDGRPGAVRVEVTLVDQDSSICICVADNGIGLPADFEQKRSHSLGLHLVSDLVGQLGGRLEIATNPGVSFSVFFKPKTGFQSELHYE